MIWAVGYRLTDGREFARVFDTELDAAYWAQRARKRGYDARVWTLCEE